MTAIDKTWLASALHRLGSLWLTLALLLVFAAALLITDAGWLAPTTAMAVPFSLLVLNLVAAIIANPRFRRSTDLLVFHLALLALVLLIVLGRLTFLNGQVAIPVGGEFDGRLGSQQQGLWHQDTLDQVWFGNNGFEVSYDRRTLRNRTYNRVQWLDSQNRLQQGVIGDDRPLLLQGYRIYTSKHRGFALNLNWVPDGANRVDQSQLLLQSWPLFRFEQAQQWSPPGSDLSLWLKLEFDDLMLDSDQGWRFEVPEQHRVVVRIGDQGKERVELSSGNSLALPGGRLTYVGAQPWMGYEFVADQTLPWLGAACAIAIGALALFYWRRFAQRSWLERDDR